MAMATHPLGVGGSAAALRRCTTHVQTLYVQSVNKRCAPFANGRREFLNDPISLSSRSSPVEGRRT